MPQPGALPLHVGDDTTGIQVRTPPVRRSVPPPIPGVVARGKRARPRDDTDKTGKKASRAQRRAAQQVAKRAAVERAREAKAARRAKRGSRRVSVAWFLVLIMAGVGGLGGFYLFEQWQTAEEEARDAKIQAISANERAASADQRAIDGQAALSRERSELQRLNGELEGVSKRASEADDLAEKLEKIVGAQGTVVRDKEKLTLEMVDKVLFRSGEAALTERGEQVLLGVGEAVKKFPEKQIWVQGHTDDIPIEQAEFASNWELSTARALTVVHYLQDEAKVDPRRMAAVGFGQHRPVSRSKRFRNRRIEIVLFPREVQLIKD